VITIIKVESLAFSYADKNVIDNVSFEVGKGQLFAILGQNAVGKTTLIKLMTGILVPQNGAISINNNVNPHTFSAQERMLIGVMQEIKGIYLKMTGYEYLSFVGAIYGMTSDAIKTSINQFVHEYKIDDDIHREVKKYSAGTKKKVEFYAAIMFEPELLFLDEPFESVDPTVQYEIKRKIKTYINEGGTLIITSHILDTIQNLCTDYLIMANGMVRSQGKILPETNLEEIFMEVVNHG